MFLVQHILIPPIILHASYELYNPQFFNQLGSILTVKFQLFGLTFLKTKNSLYKSSLQMAFVGTTLNMAIVAFGLRFIFAELMWEKMNLFHTATFASIISGVMLFRPHYNCWYKLDSSTAVDPVAVLAVFEDVEADRALYFLVHSHSTQD